MLKNKFLIKIISFILYYFLLISPINDFLNIIFSEYLIEIKFFPLQSSYIIKNSILLICLCIFAFLQYKKEMKLNILLSILLIYNYLLSILVDNMNIYVLIIISILIFLLLNIIFIEAKLNKVLSVVMGIVLFLLFLLIPFSLLANYFGDIVKNEEIKRIYSPNEDYALSIINNDQGALGGSTIIYLLNERDNRDYYFFTISKKNKMVYQGKWGEWENLNINWLDYERFKIDNKIYNVLDY